MQEDFPSLPPEPPLRDTPSQSTSRASSHLDQFSADEPSEGESYDDNEVDQPFDFDPSYPEEHASDSDSEGEDQLLLDELGVGGSWHTAPTARHTTTGYEAPGQDFEHSKEEEGYGGDEHESESRGEHDDEMSVDGASSDEENEVHEGEEHVASGDGRGDRVWDGEELVGHDAAAPSSDDEMPSYVRGASLLLGEDSHAEERHPRSRKRSRSSSSSSTSSTDSSDSASSASPGLRIERQGYDFVPLLPTSEGFHQAQQQTESSSPPPSSSRDLSSYVPAASHIVSTLSGQAQEAAEETDSHEEGEISEDDKELSVAAHSSSNLGDLGPVFSFLDKERQARFSPALSSGTSTSAPSAVLPPKLLRQSYQGRVSKSVVPSPPLSAISSPQPSPAPIPRAKLVPNARTLQMQQQQQQHEPRTTPIPIPSYGRSDLDPNPPAKRPRNASTNPTAPSPVAAPSSVPVSLVNKLTAQTGVSKFTPNPQSNGKASYISKNAKKEKRAKPITILTNPARTATTSTSPAPLLAPTPPAPLAAGPKATYTRQRESLSSSSLNQAASSLSLNKAAYTRRTTTPALTPPPLSTPASSAAPSNPSKPPGQLPLSSDEKLTRLSTKFASCFPLEFATVDAAKKEELYEPDTKLSVTASTNANERPNQSATSGFWAAPPSLNSTKGLYPAPINPPLLLVDDRPRVDIFVDNSNVIYSFLNWARARRDVKLVDILVGDSPGKTRLMKTVTINGKKVNLDYRFLFALLERGRNVGRRVLAGSSPLWQSLETAQDWGYEVSLLQRVARQVMHPHPVEQPKRKIPASYTRPTEAGLPTATASTSIPASATAPLATFAPSPSSKVDTGARIGSDGLTRTRKVGAPASRAARASPRMHEGRGPNRRKPVVKPVIAPIRVRETKSWKEQAVDELLHLKILESLLDYTPPPGSARPLIVLATGDAKASEYNPTGFLGCVQRALERGWDVEIIAFAMGTSSTWLGEEARAALSADAVGDGAGQRGKLRVIDLELFAEEFVL